MENIVITGSNGFIGSHLIDLCIKKDFNIYGLDRPNSSFSKLIHYTNGIDKFSSKQKERFLGKKIKIATNNPKLTFLECDINNKLLIEHILKELRPKYVFHFAAQPYIIPSWNNPIETIETNVIGTIHIFESIKKFEIDSRVVVACSAAEFGTTARIGRPLKETDPLMAVNPYGISKIAAELLSRQYYINFGIETINLRFFNLTGIRQSSSAPSDFIRKIAQIELDLREPLLEVGNLQPYRDLLDIGDAISAIWLATTKGTPGETYHICSGKKIQIKEILDASLNFSQKKIKVVENAPHMVRKSDEDIVVGNNSKIKSELGWSPKISINKTLKEMFDYWMDFYQKNQK